ncbi:MAG: PH domain-containing protein [Sedimentisphaerales bacterium]|nr:PH domain-containing protein [Sedimentisphaerales bacterium]
MEERDTNHTVDDDISRLLPPELLLVDEKPILALKPSRWLVLFFSFPVIFMAGCTALAAMLLGPTFEDVVSPAYIIISCTVLIGLRVVFAYLQWLSRTYVLTNKRVLRVRGVFRIDIFQADLTHIQNTFLVFTLPQRIFGLGSIVFTTAGTALPEATWLHVSKPLPLNQKVINALNTNPPKSNEGI